MSPTDLTAEYKLKKQEYKVMKQKYSRFITRMEREKTEYIIEDNSSAKEIMVDVLKHLKKK